VSPPARFAELWAAAPNGTLWHPVKDAGAWSLDAPHAAVK
jgi:hypothetical protein